MFKANTLGHEGACDSVHSSNIRSLGVVWKRVWDHGDSKEENVKIKESPKLRMKSCNLGESAWNVYIRN